MGDYEKKIALIITKDTMVAQSHSQNFKPQIHQQKKKKVFQKSQRIAKFTL